jgi:hypothetical protein
MWKGWKFLHHQFRGYGLESPTGETEWFPTTLIPSWLANVKQAIEESNMEDPEIVIQGCFGNNEIAQQST